MEEWSYINIYTRYRSVEMRNFASVYVDHGQVIFAAILQGKVSVTYAVMNSLLYGYIWLDGKEICLSSAGGNTTRCLPVSTGWK